MHGARRSLFFEDRCTFFVGHDGALEFAEGESLFGRDLDLADDVFAFVVELVGLGGDGGVVAGEVLVNADGVGNFIDDKAGWKSDDVGVVPAASGSQVDGQGAGLVVERLDEGA
jgi:hypothetical protein